jgi:hypothetical protein
MSDTILGVEKPLIADLALVRPLIPAKVGLGVTTEKLSTGRKERLR